MTMIGKQTVPILYAVAAVGVALFIIAVIL